ncbi:hypothetical protein A3A50_02255 [Candidatus Woesebacteria bacterium RIFCSPLOWO2_01_FULL_38_20]|nr:MAG: hypothetical protein A3A50_02255 [Candidatus Woesebacteria bacterium RIFCSPLOWO2_01_FULL_38_20]
MKIKTIMNLPVRQAGRFISTKAILVIVIVIAGILRLWNLGNIPPHLTPDEASLGYNAYSILKTGRDEYGTLLPVIFKSFGDYKPGLYVYLTVPSVAVFGLNEFAVRLPSAIAGILTIMLLYKISKILFNEKIGLLAACLAVINPWLIHFSRGAWEANISLTLTLAGIYFFLTSFKDQKKLIVSAIFFALTLVTYQGAKLSTGIVIIILAVIYFKQILVFNRRYLLLGFISGILISFPIIFSLFSGKVGRLEVFSISSYRRPGAYLQNQLNQGNEKAGSLSYYLFHSEVFNTFRGITGRYFNHFSGRFLFFEGDWQNPRHSPPNQGEFLFADIILIILGLIILVKKGLGKDPSTSSGQESIFILLWLVLAPLPAALSRDSVHAIRSLNMAIPIIIISSFGLVYIFENINKARVLRLVSFGFFIFYILNFVYYLDTYFIHLPKHDSQLWDYGYKQIVETVTPIQNNYKTIKVQQSFAQPYIYFLFFQKYDPAKYQKQAKLVASEYKNDVGYVTKLDNIEFVPIDWSVNRGDNGTLIVGDPIRIPPEDSNDPSLFKLVKEIKYLDGQPAFRIIEVK